MADGVAVISKERFSELVLRYERLVYTVCFQLVREPGAAEDLTQETFLSAYIHRESLPEGYERQWLCRVAANKAKDHLQSAWSRRTVLPGDEALFSPGLAPGIEGTLPAGVPAVPAGGAEPGGGSGFPGQAGEDRLYTAHPGEEAPPGGIGKEWRAWYFVRTGT